MSSSSTSNLLTTRVVARNPYWQQIQPEEQIQTAFFLEDGSGVPLGGLDGSGSDIGSPKTHVWLSCRRRPDRRHALLRITTVDTSATYSVTIDGTASSYDAGAAGVTTVSAIYAGLFAAIFDGTPPTGITGELIQAGTDPNGQPVYSGILVYPEDPTLGTFTSITIDAFSTTGSAVLGVYVEPDDYAVELWAQPVRGVGNGEPFAYTWVRIYGDASLPGGGGGGGGGGLEEPGGGGGGGLFSGAPGVVTAAGLRVLLDTPGLERIMSVTDDTTATMPAGQAAGVQPLRWIHLGPAVDES
jgi:hypothetical protein